MKLSKLKAIVVSFRETLRTRRLHPSWRAALEQDLKDYQAEIDLIERGLGVGMNVDIERKEYEQ